MFFPREIMVPRVSVFMVPRVSVCARAFLCMCVCVCVGVVCVRVYA